MLLLSENQWPVSEETFYSIPYLGLPVLCVVGTIVLVLGGLLFRKKKKKPKN